MVDFYIYAGLKLAAGFGCLIIYLNISGRAQLAPNSAVDQIGNYVLGGIIGGMIYNQDIRILEMVIIIAIWSVLILVTRFVKNRNRFAKKLIDGSSMVMYSNGQFNTQNMQFSNRSVKDVIAGLHMQGIHRLDEVNKVWLETNGNYTAEKKGETPFAIAVVESNKIAADVLDNIDHDEDWVIDQLNEWGFKLDRILYAEWLKDEGPFSRATVKVYPE